MQGRKEKWMKQMKCAWIGLGVMGFPMAGHLRKKSAATVTVYNRTPSKAKDWQAQFGGTTAATPAAAVVDADFVFACVGNDDDLRAVTTGEQGAFRAMKPGAVFVDHTTASADVARELADAAQRHAISFIDAPVSGGQAGAENGALTVMCGGQPEVFTKAEPLIMTYARTAKLLGPHGSGQLAKMCNQIAIAGVVQGLAECISFGLKAALNMEDVVAVISKGAAGSWQMDNRHKTMIVGQFDFGFAVDWMRKDLSICLREANKNGAPLPLTALVDQFYADVQNAGGKRWDTSSLITRLTS